MLCHCADKFDFFLIVRGNEQVLFQDLSEWIVQGSYEKPDVYTLELVHPAGGLSLIEVLADGRVTQILTEGYAEGIYTFILKTCRAEELIKYELIAPGAKCKIECLILGAKNQEEVVRYNEILLYLSAAEGHARRKEFMDAVKKWRIAVELLDQYECNC